MNLIAIHKLRLLRELYETVYNEAESFEEENIGADLAYLMGAVLNGSSCDWEEDRSLVRLLREQLPANHRVWAYIHIEAAM